MKWLLNATSSKSLFFILLLVIVLLLTMVAGCAPAEPEALPEDEPEALPEDEPEVEKELEAVVVFGTFPVGTSHNVVTSGFAALVSDYAPFRATVKPTAGPNAFIPEMDVGSVHFGMSTGIDAAWGYRGGPGYATPAENLRLVFSGGFTSRTTNVVRKDSDIMTTADLKGKRVAWDYGGNFLIHEIIENSLKAVGLTVDDIIAVPVADFASGLNMLQDGAVDAAFGGNPGTPQLLELDASIGIRPLSLGDLKPEDLEDDNVRNEIQTFLNENIPGTVVYVIKAGSGVFEEDTVSLGLDNVISASKLTSSEAVYHITKIAWEHYEEMHAVHPWAESWHPDAMLIENFGTPYHDGAIRFYKEMGVWTEEHQQMQDMLLRIHE